MPGKFGSDESRLEYERILALLRINDGNVLDTRDQADVTINEIALRFMTEFVIPYYVDPVTKLPTGEQDNIKCSLRPLTRLFGDLPAREFPRIFGEDTEFSICRSSKSAGPWQNSDGLDVGTACTKSWCKSCTAIFGDFPCAGKTE